MNYMMHCETKYQNKADMKLEKIVLKFDVGDLNVCVCLERVGGDLLT